VSERQPDEQARENAFRARCLPCGSALLDYCPPVSPGEVPQPVEDAATWRGLASAVALTSARLGGLRVGHADIASDVPVASVLGAALVLLVAVVREHLGEDNGLTMLQSIGLSAASESAERPAA
jgi:hypothetical protein